MHPAHYWSLDKMDMQEVQTKDTDTVWHHVSSEIVLEKLKKNSAGLSKDEAKERLTTHGRKHMPQTAKHSVVMRFRLPFHNILIYVLIGLAVIKALLDHWIDTGIILAVLISNTIIGFIQEGKAEKLWTQSAISWLHTHM